jgi:spermidine synthase
MPPALAGVVDMYTREFYELSLDHLAPGGIMSQWVPLYYLGYDDIRMLYRTFAESFPYVLVFSHSFDTFLVGSNQPLVISPEKYRDRLQSDELVRDLALIGLAAPEHMAGTFLMDREALLELAGDAPVVTDDLPYVEFTAPKSADMSSTAPNYLAVTRYAKPVLPYLSEGSGPNFERLVAALESTYRENLVRWSMAREAHRRREGRHTSR